MELKIGAVMLMFLIVGSTWLTIEGGPTKKLVCTGKPLFYDDCYKHECVTGIYHKSPLKKTCNTPQEELDKRRPDNWFRSARTKRFKQYLLTLPTGVDY